MIKRVRISGYKSFKKLDLSLSPVTVIFGPNASGKSNFLDALYLVSRAVTRRNLNEAFEGHRGLPLESFYYGEEGYENLLERGRVEFSFEVDVQLSPTVVQTVEETVRAKRMGMESPPLQKRIITHHDLRYHLAIEALADTGYLRVKDERLCAIRPNGIEKKNPSPFIERKQGSIHLRMEGQGRPIFREIGLDHTIASTALYEPHYPHITAFRLECMNWSTYYLEPKTLMREDVPLADIESIGARGENLAAFLNTLKVKQPKVFDGLNLTLKRVLPMDTSIDITRLKEGRVGLRLCEGGIWFSARLVSEGTLRLIGLLASVQPSSPATLVAFEEPENGVHPVRLKLIGEMLKNAAYQYGKQIIVTTHSPIIPEYFDDRDLFVCSKDERQTVIKPFVSIGPMFRRQNIAHALEDMIVRGDFGG